MHDMGCIYQLLVLNGARIQNDEWPSPILISQSHPLEVSYLKEFQTLLWRNNLIGES